MNIIIQYYFLFFEIMVDYNINKKKLPIYKILAFLNILKTTFMSIK